VDYCRLDAVSGPGALNETLAAAQAEVDSVGVCAITDSGLTDDVIAPEITYDSFGYSGTDPVAVINTTATEVDLLPASSGV
jgi:thiamine pyrophosphate-dependent acetolactate synthase large subunit-like protein